MGMRIQGKSVDCFDWVKMSFYNFLRLMSESGGQIGQNGVFSEYLLQSIIANYLGV